MSTLSSRRGIHHRRTESTPNTPSKRSSTLPPSSTTTTTSRPPRQQHHRSKSWLTNIFKPHNHASNQPEERTLKTHSRSSSLFNRTRSRTTPPTATNTTSIRRVLDDDENRPLDDEFGSKRRHQVVHTSSLPRSTSYAQREGTSTARMDRDLAKRLASWGFSSSSNRVPSNESLETLNIRNEDRWNVGENVRGGGIDEEKDYDEKGREEEEQEQSLGTVWKGFLVDVDDSGFDGQASTNTMTTGTSTMENTRHGGGGGEVSFADSSLAMSTTSQFTLSAFPFPTGPIAFTDPFASSPPLPLPFEEGDRPLPPPRSLVSQPSTSTLAERRFRTVPQLRIDPNAINRPPSHRSRGQARRKVSNATSISASVYSNNDDYEDEDGFAGGGGEGFGRYTVDYDEGLGSYFSPISPQAPPFLHSTDSSISQGLDSFSISPTATPGYRDLNESSPTNRSPLSSTINSSQPRPSISPSTRFHSIPYEDTSLNPQRQDQLPPTTTSYLESIPMSQPQLSQSTNSTLSSTSTSSSHNSNARYSVLFDVEKPQPSIPFDPSCTTTATTTTTTTGLIPPSSTSTGYTSIFETNPHVHDDDEGHNKVVAAGEEEDGGWLKREEDRSGEMTVLERYQGKERGTWRVDWKFKPVESTVSSKDVERQDSQRDVDEDKTGRREVQFVEVVGAEKGNWETDFEAVDREDSDSVASEGEELSLEEAERRLELYNRREVERRMRERKERWREERIELYGEPSEAEYEFGLAL